MGFNLITIKMPTAFDAVQQMCILFDLRDGHDRCPLIYSTESSTVYIQYRKQADCLVNPPLVNSSGGGSLSPDRLYVPEVLSNICDMYNGPDFLDILLISIKSLQT